MSWCTVWKGTPQDLMDHVRGAHNVPGEVKNVSLETLFPPWTVTRQVYTDSLTSLHSGISKDVLLFSDIGLSLIHHYRVHKRGLPHVAFRMNYMLQLHALLPLPTVLPIEGGSPDPACSSVSCVVESPDVVCASPRPSFGGGGDLLSLICPELGITPQIDPGTDLEDELSIPASPPAADEHVDSELEQVFGDVGSLPTMVTPVCDLDGGLRVTPAECPVLEPPGMSVVMTQPSMVYSPAGGLLVSASDVSGSVHAGGVPVSQRC